MNQAKEGRLRTLVIKFDELRRQLRRVAVDPHLGLNLRDDCRAIDQQIDGQIAMASETPADAENWLEAAIDVTKWLHDRARIN